MGRNGTFDHARLLAAFGIVVFHAGAPARPSVMPVCRFS
jgi:peptidoglycan/LPS O-acetylase OafA/YrhL